jgi:mRNA interferase HigB
VGAFHSSKNAFVTGFGAGHGLDRCSQNWEHRELRVFGEGVIAAFARRHPASRKPLQRFVTISRAAVWPHFPAVRETFPAPDYAPAGGTLVFNIGGNKYRLIARVDFEEQWLAVRTVLSHQDYSREDL